MTWDINRRWGPGWGHGRISDGRFIITQTPQIQREIDVILAALRANSNRPIAAEGF
jgi:hypothetical protein